MNYKAIAMVAHKAGMIAAESQEQQLISAVDVQTGYRSEPFPICGFAEIRFPGNKPFGRWAKKAGLAKKAYPKGLHIWVSEFGQSYDKKKAYAEAFAEVLQLHGIDAYATSRPD